jgi:hypothetical protein
MDYLFATACLALTLHGAEAQTLNGTSSGGFTKATSENAPNPANANPIANGPKFSSSRPAGPLTPINYAQGEPNLGRITAGNGVLPNDAGQVWREYDLTPYTSRVKDVEKPEQAIIDWIIRDTGTDTWFSAPLGILSANRTTLRVYHTTQVHEIVKGVYDRFLSSSAATNRLGIRIITVNSPNWRSRALPIMKPVEVKSAGVEAWLLPREYAVLLMNELKQRPDVKEQNSGIVEVINGQTKPFGLTRPRNYMRSLRPRTDGFGAFEAEMATIEEGYAISLSPLASADGKTLDLVVKCNIDQVERLIEVPVDVPSPLGTTQRISLQVPQLVSWRLHERFRWPVDQVLLLSCGVVAAPGNESKGLPLLGSLAGNPRADALLFIEPILSMPTLPPANFALPPNPAPLPNVAPVTNWPNNLARLNPFAPPAPTIPALPNTTGNLFPNPAAQPSGTAPFIATPMIPQGRFSEPWRR